MLYQDSPEIEVLPLPRQGTGDLLLRLIPCDNAIFDASDNVVTRHALNQPCILHKKKLLISGAVVRFDEQVPVFDLRNANNPATPTAKKYQLKVSQLAFNAIPRIHFISNCNDANRA